MSYCTFALLFAFAAGMHAQLGVCALDRRQYRASGNAIAACFYIGIAIWLVR